MFSKEPHDKELPSKDGVIGLDSIDIPPADPLEQYLLDHENNMNIHERNELDNMFFKKKTILKQNILVETLGGPPPPKGDPVFELKTLPDTLKCAYLAERKIYHVIISAYMDKLWVQPLTANKGIS